MTLRKRIDRLEFCKDESCKAPAPIAAVLRLVVTPSASGPVLVAALVRRADEPWQHIDREPGEAVDAFTARAMAGASGGHGGGYRQA